MTLRWLPLLAVACLVLSAVFAAAALAVPRPPLPSPMPAIVRGECPARPTAAGCSYAHGLDGVSAPVVYVGIRDLATTLHELGHIYIAQRFDAGNRAALIRVMVWWRVWHEEDAADLYAACRAERPVVRQGFSGMVWYPGVYSERRARIVCGVIARAFWR